MDDLAAERLAVTSSRSAWEAALRSLRSVEAHADFWREDDGSFAVVDQGLNPEIFAEIAQVQIDLAAATAAADAARLAREQAVQAYDTAARAAPLFAVDNADPLLLLPVRMEAIYADNAGAAELRIRVYPDDVHVDSHEPALTAGERESGMTYWGAVWAAGEDRTKRQAAWRDLVGSCGGGRATWVREALTPLNAPPAVPEFPNVEIRPEAWTRAAQTLLMPDHFEFSAYRDGALVWRRDGAPIPDTLAVGVAPQPGEGDPESAVLPFDDSSRWLVDFDLAVTQGMAVVAPLAHAEERFDLLTVVGVGTQDGSTGAQRVQQMLAAHAFSGGLAPLPAGTPTNNTPGSRSGWRSRGAPPDPDTVTQWRTAFDAAGEQEAARLARALGVDGAPVLAGACDPAGGDEPLLRRLHQLQAAFYSWSRVFGPASNTDAESRPNTDAWFATLADHFTRFVRARGSLPLLRIGRQPYGLLPVSSTDLWRGDDVDGAISRFVASFLAAFAAFSDRAVQIGEGADQDALLLDLLSREGGPRRVVDALNFTVDATSERPPVAAVGAIPATSTFAWMHPDVGPGPEEPGGDPFRIVEAFPEAVPDELQQIAAEHPLAQLLVLFDESLQHMRDTLVPPDPAAFSERYVPLAGRLSQLRSAPTRSLFYDQAEWSYNALNNTLPSGPALPDDVAKRIARGTEFRNLLARYVPFEDDVSGDLPGFERLFRESLEPLSHRIDAWVTSLATARLAGIRAARPTGVLTGAYGWLMDVEPVTPNPQREGYVVTPSLHHATTAAVLRSGWQAHSDRRAFAVDIQSARVRRAQAMIEGVRVGQTVGALLGYQFERALHDAHLDRFIAGFRAKYPLAPVVDPAAPGTLEAQVSIGARNVVDGQALRRDRALLDDPAELQVAADAELGEDGPTLRRLLAELDETFDAVGDLLVAESVHQLVGGSPLRAGLAADAIGRGQDLPLDYDVVRTPRGGIGATHHVGMLLPSAMPPGWADDRPLVRLEPRLEGWLRKRLGPAEGWALGPPLADLGWCALDLLVAAPDSTHGLLAAVGVVDDATFDDLMLVCARLRAAVVGAAPLNPAHIDPVDPAPISGYDLTELHGRVTPWLGDLRAAATELGAATTTDTAIPVLQRLGTFGMPIGGGGAGDVDRVRAVLAAVDLSDPGAPPDPVEHPGDAAAWLARTLTTTSDLLHPAVCVVPVLNRELPPPPQPAVDDDAIAAWLRDMTLVRPRIDALDRATIAAEIIAGTTPAPVAVVQPVTESGADAWIAVTAPRESRGPRCSLVLQRDDAAAGRLCGLVVDSWTEVVPRAPGSHGPEEVIGVAFDFDRPDARAPQAMLLAVPPDADRGWSMEDVHACVDEALLLAKIRTLDLQDLPELRGVLPIPGPG